MSHIDIINPKDCCGCGACVAGCPSNCIEMVSDTEGFLYPQINIDSCTDCGLCLKKCPLQINRDLLVRVNPPHVYAAWHRNDNIRHQSSSGGVFTALAEEILHRCGVVAGAAFDDQMVVYHTLIEDIDDLTLLRGSKYVQSEIKPEIYRQILTFLKQGRYVLFSGTPCQVAGLRNYLNQDYETLFCCDILCHGVPSPGWFRKYIESLSKDSISITRFSFRDKQTGWKRFGIRKTWSDESFCVDGMHSDPFMESFLKNLCLRESCYSCKFTTTTRQGDLTLADYWGVANKYPEYDRDDKGTSLLLINTEKGSDLIHHCEQNLFLGKGDLEHAKTGNAVLYRSAGRPHERDSFLKDISSLSVTELRNKYKLHPPLPQPLWRRSIEFLKRKLKQAGLF